MAILLGLTVATIGGASCSAPVYGVSNTGPVDADGDGWVEELDCDDQEPLVHPEADDPAGDHVDADCDGEDG
jgi:hypothetical protein